MKTSWSIARLLVLFILFSLLTLLSLGLVLLYGTNLSILDLPTYIFGNGQESSLTINVIPYGSEILINGSVAGESPLNILVKPGKYKIEIKRNGYSPYEETVVLQSNQQVVIEYHLGVTPYMLIISGNGAYPLWIEDNSLLYFDLTNQTIARYLPDGSNNNIKELPGSITSMNYCTPAKIFVEYLPGANPGIAVQNVVAIDTITNEEVYFGIGNVTTMPLSGNCNVYLIGWYEGANTDDFSFWMGNPSEKLQQKDLPNVSQVLPPEAVKLSNDGKWLMIEGGNGINFWQYDGNVFLYISSISQAYGAVWSPNDAKLIYMDLGGSIHYIELPEQSDKTIVSPSVLLPLRWMPNGHQVVFTTYNPANGGSSFWAVDVNNGVRTLLADSSLILGRVTDFAISPDGSSIAYTNDLNHLNILFIGE